MTLRRHEKRRLQPIGIKGMPQVCRLKTGLIVEIRHTLTIHIFIYIYIYKTYIYMYITYVYTYIYLYTNNIYIYI